MLSLPIVYIRVRQEGKRKENKNGGLKELTQIENMRKFCRR